MTGPRRALRRFASADAAGRANMRQLVTLRWLAVAGQLLTVLTVHFAMGVHLPIEAMLLVIAGLLIFNATSAIALPRRSGVAEAELFGALLLDIAALTALLYLSGGATNPFASLLLVQVALGAVLLDARSSWIVVAITASCFALLTLLHRPLILPPTLSSRPFDLYIIGSLISFALVAVLLVLFVTRINANLRARDARLAAMRQHAVEEDHIVRMGLLASGAAHELGTPLASLSVIINDWCRDPALAGDADHAEELGEMRAAIERCKTIVTGILMSAGEARGERPTVTGVNAFLDELVREWRGQHPSSRFAFANGFGEDMAIVSDPALKQVIWNVLDNAEDASGGDIWLVAGRTDDALELTVRDTGPGFPDDILASIGRPYRSTKGKRGGGLGLFLVVNVMRKLGGEVTARNHPDGGAVVMLRLPLAAIALGQEQSRDG